MAGRTPKNTAMDWIAAGQRILVDEGIVGLKVDRLASRLGVSRGGFYHHFSDRDDFLEQLVRHWEATCHFLPETPPPARRAEAIAWFDGAITRLIGSDGYDYHFDLAAREWSRADTRVAWAVERADRERIATLRKFFQAIGYSGEHAATRARIFYYHQIGYYAIGARQSITERRRNAELYIDILCGKRALAAARAGAPMTWKARAA